MYLVRFANNKPSGNANFWDQVLKKFREKLCQIILSSFSCALLWWYEKSCTGLLYELRLVSKTLYNKTNMEKMSFIQTQRAFYVNPNLDKLKNKVMNLIAQSNWISITRQSRYNNLQSNRYKQDNLPIYKIIATN